MPHSSPTLPFNISAYNTLALAPQQMEEVLKISAPDALVEAVKTYATQGKHVHVAGELSNTVLANSIEAPIVLFRDGAVASINEEAGHHVVRVQGSCSLSLLVKTLCDAGIAGLEKLSGIPGTVGAGLVQNVGAYGAELATYFTQATLFCPATGEISEVTPQGFAFTYRNTRFKRPKTPEDARLVLEAVFRMPAGLTPGPLTYAGLAEQHAKMGRDAGDIQAIRQTVLEVRSQKGMVAHGENWVPSAGSFFMNPTVSAAQGADFVAFLAQNMPEDTAAKAFLTRFDASTETVRIPAALAMKAAGFSNGDQFGPVGLSPHHLLGLTAHQGAKGEDIWQLAAHVQRTVLAKTGIALSPEVLPLGALPDALSAEDFAKTYAHTPGNAQPEWVGKG